jgi:predicted Zn-dependent protease
VQDDAPAPAPVAAQPPPPEPAVEEQAPAPARPVKARTTARSAQETLTAARQSMASNDLQGAARHYGALTRRRTLLPDVLADLKVAVSRLPDSPELWQALGDAYMKADQAAEAVEAYRHGLANL